MRTKLRKGQKGIGSVRIELPNGDAIELDVYTQPDGGTYTTQYYARRNGGVKPGETCFYCDGKKLGCITCPKGQSPSGNCINGTTSCERDRPVAPEAVLRRKKR